MRLIGHLPTQPAAVLFSHYLRLQGITHVLEQEREGWAVWVHSEDELGKAQALLLCYVGDPEDPKFRLGVAVQNKQPDRPMLAEPRAPGDAAVLEVPGSATRRKFGMGPLTLALVLGCALIGLLSEFGENMEMLGSLFICPFVVDGSYTKWQTGLSEIFSGELWRLFTPILVHYGFVHLLLNMLWLVQLGSMIESCERTTRLAWLVLLIAGVSNLGQYALCGPNFGGMSGVVYGLLSYVWMKSRFQPGSGYFLDLRTVTFMLIWFFLCLAGIIPDVANGAHFFGLLVGLASGFISAKRQAWKTARA